jgi:hypothetical protein
MVEADQRVLASLDGMAKARKLPHAQIALAWLLQKEGVTSPIVGATKMEHLEADVRVGGTYRFVFGHDASKPMAFFGRYIEVTPHSRLVWTNDESDRGAVTTVTFDEKGGKTRLVVSELYPSKEALDAANGGMEGGLRETFEQLDELLVTLGASVGRS